MLASFPPGAEDFKALDVFTLRGCFGFSFPHFRIGNVYPRLHGPLAHLVFPETSLPFLDFRYLVAGDFNIHNPAANPFRILPAKEEKETTSYFQQVSELCFSLLNIPSIYTRFPFTASHRSSTIDLYFANTYLFRALHFREAAALPLTSSDHISMFLSFQPPYPS